MKIPNFPNISALLLPTTLPGCVGVAALDTVGDSEGYWAVDYDPKTDTLLTYFRQLNDY